MKSLAAIPGSTLGVDVVSFPRTTHRANALLPFAARLWAFVGWLFVAGAAAGLLLRRRIGNRGAPILVALLALSAMLARIGVLAVIDSSAWSGLQARYIFPVVPCFAVLGVVGLWLLAERAGIAEARGSDVHDDIDAPGAHSEVTVIDSTRRA